MFTHLAPVEEIMIYRPMMAWAMKQIKLGHCSPSVSSMIYAFYLHNQTHKKPKIEEYFPYYTCSSGIQKNTELGRAFNSSLYKV